MASARPHLPSYGQRFAEALASFDPNREVLLLGHFDADGLAALALLARGLERAGQTVEIRVVGKGENPWSPELKQELVARRPGGLIVADLGVRDGELLPGCPTILIDHHVPTGKPGAAMVISGNGAKPEPTSALLAFWCVREIAAADDLLWLAAIGLVGDMADKAGFEEMTLAETRYGKTALRSAVSLINAPRRSAAADASPALALLLKCAGPKEVLSGAHPETASLLAAKREVQDALESVKRMPPKIRGEVALFRFSSPCQIHPLVAQQWRTRLRDKIVIAANSGYRPGWIHFAARTATGRDLIQFLAAHRPDGANGHYGSGHRQATGGALPVHAWNAFISGLGFPEEQIEHE